MLSIAAGYDPGYLTRSVGLGAENYYLSAVAEHGEPPGIWWGEGAEALGFEVGEVVDPQIMERLYSTFLDPRDPEFLNSEVSDEEKSHLGRRPSSFKSGEDIYRARLEAEPEATAERQEELRIESARAERKAVYFFDLTFSPVKSVSLLHAGLQASALAARQAGQEEQAAAYARAADAVWDGVMAGASASLAYTRDHAGAARTGYHGVEVEGRTTGRWTDAGRWVVAQFRQHTNREGEPQLHVHQAVLNRQLCDDGQWRTLDSRAVHKVRAAAAAVGERVTEEYLTRVLGVEWRARPDGHGREVVGVTEAQIEAFSTRRVQVTEDLKRRIEDYEAVHGRAPSARALFTLAQHATKATKAGKPKAEDVPTRAEELAEWQRRTSEREIELLTEIPGAALGRVRPEQAAVARERLVEMDMQRVISAAVAEAQKAKAQFSRYEVIRHLNAYLPDHLGGLPAERVEALLEQLADLALDPAGINQVRLLNVPELVEAPPALRRADGRSVYEAPCAQRYTTARQLDAETAVMLLALGNGAPRLDASAVAASLGIAAASPTDPELDGPAGEGAGDAGDPAHAASGEAVRFVPGLASLRPDQAAAVYGIATSSRRVDVLVGPAGAGKSYTVTKLADVWRAYTGAPVIGLTTAQSAAQVLITEGLDSAYNIDRWLRRIDSGQLRVEPGQLIVVDEASMVATGHLERIQRLAERAGAKVVWTGDQEQLGAPGVGGMMRQMVATAGAYELVTVQRMNEEWEREASLRLRDGDTQVLTEYDRRGRLLDGDREEMENAAYRAYVADYVAGKRSLLLTPTNEKAAELSARVREDLVAYGLVSERGVTLRDGNTAGAGDLIMARLNGEVALTATGEAVPITNRDVLKVDSVGAGTLMARLIGKDGRPGELVTIGHDYVDGHIELAYAGTVHAAQGRTVDTCHSVVDEQVTRNMLYVMLSRAKDGNYAYAVTEKARQADLRPGPEQRAEGVEPVRAGGGLPVLAAALQRTEDDQTALESMRAEAQRVTHLGHLSAMWLDVQQEYAADAYIDQAEARGTLTGDDAARLRTDQAKGVLGRLLRQLEMSGRDAHGILDGAIAAGELSTAESTAQVLHWRIGQAGEQRGVDMSALEPSEAQIQGTWTQRTPKLGRADLDGFLGRLASLMDRRTVNLGQRAAEQAPAWLVEQLGAPAADPVEREGWIQRAGRVLAYREQYGYASQTDAIGAAPGRANIEQRVSWYAAYDALGRPQTERDVSAATLGELWVTRAQYERETRWAPPYVAEELKQVSITAREHAAEAVRLRAQAEVIEDAERRDALLAEATGYEAMASELEIRRAQLTEVDDARQAWHQATEDSRIMAMRADAELRRRPEVEAVLLPPLHREADGTEPPTREHEAANDKQVHVDQLALDLDVPEVEQLPLDLDLDLPETEPVTPEPQAVVNPPEPEPVVEVEAPIRGQVALDLYGEAAHGGQADAEESTLSRAILQARSAVQVIAGRGLDVTDGDAERLERSQAERIRAEAYAEHEHERLAAEREALEQRERSRAEQHREELDRGEEMSL